MSKQNNTVWISEANDIYVSKFDPGRHDVKSNDPRLGDN